METGWLSYWRQMTTIMSEIIGIQIFGQTYSTSLALCKGNLPVSFGVLSQRVINTETVSMSGCIHDICGGK